MLRTAAAAAAVAVALRGGGVQLVAEILISTQYLLNIHTKYSKYLKMKLLITIIVTNNVHNKTKIFRNTPYFKIHRSYKK